MKVTTRLSPIWTDNVTTGNQCLPWAVEYSPACAGLVREHFDNIADAEARAEQLAGVPSASNRATPL